MPDLEAQIVIPPVSTGIGDARRFTREQLARWGQDGLTETAMLMISELVTNAILHGGEGAVLTLVLLNGRLRAEVRDASPATPVVRGYSETATTGRGMVIVDALADSWGSFPVDGGKVVWFEVDTVGSASFSADGEAGRLDSQGLHRGPQTGLQGSGPTTGLDGMSWPTSLGRMPVLAAP